MLGSDGKSYLIGWAGPMGGGDYYVTVVRVWGALPTV